MAKADQVKAIKAANGVELDVETYNGTQLAELQKLAEDGKTDLTAFNAKRKEFDDAKAAATAQGGGTQPATLATGEKAVRVRVNDTIAAYDGEFTDPENGQVIGKTPVDVVQTAFVRAKLRNDELVEA